HLRGPGLCGRPVRSMPDQPDDRRRISVLYVAASLQTRKHRRRALTVALVASRTIVDVERFARRHILGIWFSSFVVLGSCWNIFEISRDRLEIIIIQLRGREGDHLRHWAVRNGSVVPACLEKRNDLVDAPVAQS